MAWTWTDSKSHSEETLRQAVRDGKRLVALDSGPSGNDDILIMEAGESLENIRHEVEQWLDLGPDDPSPFDSETNTWTLREIEPEELD